MIRSVLSVPKDKLSSLACPALTQYDTDILQEFCEILEPFEEATNRVQSEKTVSASFPTLCTRGLQMAVTDMESKYNCKLVNALKASVKKRLSVYLDRSCYTIATILDPRYKLQWCATTGEASHRRSILLEEANRFSLSDLAPTTDSSHQQKDIEDTQPPPKKRKRLFSFLEDNPASPSQTRATTSVDSELEDYLSEPCIAEDSNPVEYWKGHQATLPTLSKMACTFLAISTSSARVERLFSIAGKIFHADRCRLSDGIFEQLLFIRCNQNL